MDRKSGIDYLRELKDVRKSLDSLTSHVSKRLGELIKKYPEAIVYDMRIKDMTSDYHNFSVETQILYIVKIEEWLNHNSNIKQLTIG